LSTKSAFLNGHVTLKAGVMMLNIQLGHHRNKIYSNRKDILKLLYIYFFNNFSEYYFIKNQTFEW